MARLPINSPRRAGGLIFWSHSDPSVHYAFVEFSDMNELRRATSSEDFKFLIADYDRVWSSRGVTNAIRAHLAEFGIVAPVGCNGVEHCSISLLIAVTNGYPTSHVRALPLFAQNQPHLADETPDLVHPHRDRREVLDRVVTEARVDAPAATPRPRRGRP